MSYKSPTEDFKYNLAMLNYDEVIAGIEKFKEYDSETLMSVCLLYTSPSPRDLSTSRMPSSA